MPSLKDDFATLRDEPGPMSTGPSSYALQVVEGPDAGKAVIIDPSTPSRVLVGTGPACELRLSDRAVSRRHFAVELCDHSVRITDLGSTNGTWLGNTSLVEALVQGGETLRIGGTTLRLVKRSASVSTEPPSGSAFGRTMGASAEMRRLYPLCARIAASNVPAIIEGETGTGKEVLAEALHEEGPRANGPFVVFDCTTVHPNVVESELFGHERGAFTGAVSSRKGVFEQAHGGTLLIDEIGDLDLAMQPKLLRAIERSEVRRVGGDRPLQVDVRLLFATRRNLDAMVEAGLFRDDLFHRIAVARIELPPLRRRAGDVRLLVEHFTRAMNRSPSDIPAHLLASWERDAWSGNVRALRNAVARWLALGELGHSVGSGPAAPLTAAQSVSPPAVGQYVDYMDGVLERGLELAQARQEVVAEFERRYVERVLAAHGGNIARAAAASGIARRHFHRIKARLQRD